MKPLLSSRQFLHVLFVVANIVSFLPFIQYTPLLGANQTPVVTPLEEL